MASTLVIMAIVRWCHARVPGGIQVPVERKIAGSNCKVATEATSVRFAKKDRAIK